MFDVGLTASTPCSFITNLLVGGSCFGGTIYHSTFVPVGGSIYHCPVGDATLKH
jgi:hypothetical protein